MFTTIQEKRGLSYLTAKYKINDKDDTKISTVSKELKIKINNLTKAIKSIEKNLQKIDNTKKQEIKKIISSQDKSIDWKNKVMEIINTKKLEEHKLENELDAFSKTISDIEIDINVCNYLSAPDKEFNALEIVRLYEKSHMQDIYSADTDTLLVISSHFTNLALAKNIHQSVITINRYISDYLNQSDNKNLNEDGSNSLYTKITHNKQFADCSISSDEGYDTTVPPRPPSLDILSLSLQATDSTSLVTDSQYLLGAHT